MRSLLREPLLHFFALGALLFALYAWLQGGSAKAPDAIVVTRGQQQSLALQFERTRQRPPTPEEQQGLIDSWVREEVLYREGLAMGLDRDDPVVRRRVGQKMEFITGDAMPAAPTARELQGWLDRHPGQYTTQARYTLQQIHFDPARRGDKVMADIAAARRALESGKLVMGDSTMLPATLTDATASQVQRAFGKPFVDALQTLPTGGWQGPVRSGFGLHLVRLVDRVPARQATLEQARAEVERDLLQARAIEAREAYFQTLRGRYSIRIEPVGAPADAR
jgi:hypothetical protein